MILVDFQASHADIVGRAIGWRIHRGREMRLAVSPRLCWGGDGRGKSGVWRGDVETPPQPPHLCSYWDSRASWMMRKKERLGFTRSQHVHNISFIYINHFQIVLQSTVFMFGYCEVTFLSYGMRSFVALILRSSHNNANILIIQEARVSCETCCERDYWALDARNCNEKILRGEA